MLWPSTHKQKLPCKRQIQQTYMAHYTLYSSKRCWLYTNTQSHPASLLSSFSWCHPFFLSMYTWCNLISSQYFSLSFRLCLSVFSSNTFHKWQGERCPLKVIARLIKFPPPRKEQENVIKEKRRELERINLPRRPSTPGPCPFISDEENEKCKRILKKAETGWQLWHGDGNQSNTGVMRNRRDEREVRKRNESMTGNSQKNCLCW